jgi:hypothetical protein
VEPTADAHETAMVTDGVPVTIVYPEDGSWELNDKTDAEAEAAASQAAAGTQAAGETAGAGEQAASDTAGAGTGTEAAAETAGAGAGTQAAGETSEDAQEEMTVPKLEEELLSTSVAAAERLREMTKKDAEPAPLGDMIKVVLALLLAGAALIYMLITSSMG